MKKTPVTQEQIGDLPCQNHTKRIGALERQAKLVNEYWPLILLISFTVSVTTAVVIGGFKYDKRINDKIDGVSKQISNLNVRFSAFKTDDSVRKIIFKREIDSIEKKYLAGE